MPIPRWNPATKTTRQEDLLLRRLATKRKLFGFLRRHRDTLFDDAFQAELEAMYRDTGAGKEPVPPALFAMAVLLQGYDGVSDAEAVERTVIDLRWQMVLDRLGTTEPAFSQGALHDFRHRLIRHEMDRRLLERTIELAKATKEFDWKKLPGTLRIAVDSAPLEGAGRVEDTFNLLGHAARVLVVCVASLLGWPFERVCQQAGVPVLLASSVKRGLDLDWSDPKQKTEALTALVAQVEALGRWIEQRLPEHTAEPPLKPSLDTLKQLVAQDIEPDPSGGGRKRIRKGVAPNRRISVRDPEMRHGRKSKSQRINGYKRHIATCLDTGLILGGAITPANRPEGEASPALRQDLEHQGVRIGALNIDRAYIQSVLVDTTRAEGGEILCRPWTAANTNGQTFTKTDFRFDMRARTITCPAGQKQPFRLGMVVEFEAVTCDECEERAHCTKGARGRGRLVRIRQDEPLQHRLRKLVATKKGRARLRNRIPVEHHLAHIVQRQGRRARYFGVRVNLFDLRRAATLQNLETIQRKMAA
jgi:Transposase DDE domain/Transposase domain (DUF772)